MPRQMPLFYQLEEGIHKKKLYFSSDICWAISIQENCLVHYLHFEVFSAFSILNTKQSVKVISDLMNWIRIFYYNTRLPMLYLEVKMQLGSYLEWNGIQNLIVAVGLSCLLMKRALYVYLVQALIGGWIACILSYDSCNKQQNYCK